jgi:hypothetical protein
VGEPKHDKFILAEGNHWDEADGYLPLIVKELCKALGIKTESA